MKNILKNKAIFWDYDGKKINWQDPRVKVWYLNRKLQFGDLDGLRKNDLKKYLPQLSINPSLRELLVNFLAKHE
jgi:hypothetical protein